MNNNGKSRGFGKKGWMVIIFTLFIYMFTCTAPDTLNVSVTVFAQAFGWDSNQMLMFSAVGGFAGIAVSAVLGVVIAKKGVKIPTFVMMIASALIWLFHGHVHAFVTYGLAVVLLTAFSNALNLVSTQQIMSNWFPKKKGIALGWATMGTCFSSAIMVAVFQGMFGKGISAPYHLMFGIFIILAIITMVWFKQFPEEAGAYPDNEPITEEERQANLAMLNNAKTEFTIGKLLRTKEMWMLTIIFGFVALGLVAVISQMVPRLVAVGLGQNMAIMYLTIASIIGIPASVIWGFIDQKLGTNKTVRVFCVLWTLMLVISALGSGMVNVPMAVFSVIFYAILLGGMMNLMPSAIISVFGRFDFADANKIIMPLIIGIRSCAFLLVPVMLAAAGPNVNGGYRNAFIVCAVLSAISTIVAFLLKDKCIGRTSIS